MQEKLLKTIAAKAFFSSVAEGLTRASREQKQWVAILKNVKDDCATVVYTIRRCETLFYFSSNLISPNVKCYQMYI